MLSHEGKLPAVAGTVGGMDEKSPDAPPSEESLSRARAVTKHPTPELGRAFAGLLAESLSHQLGVAARLGIPWRTHGRWMAADAEPGSDLAVYQSEVLAALDRQRVADLKSIESAVDDAPGTHAGTIWNVRKHRHESRFRRFYDDASKHEVELSGPDKGAIETATTVRYVVAIPPDEADE